MKMKKVANTAVNLSILRVVREIGSCSGSIAKIVGVDGTGNPEIERLRRAVSTGDGQACADLGDAYDLGLGVAPCGESNAYESDATDRR